jgi:hypothetical protein
VTEAEKPASVPLRCRIFGHRVRFWAEGSTMRWECERDCGFAASKEYPTAAEAERYASAFDREDREDIGKRSPLSLIALRFARRRSPADERRD